MSGPYCATCKYFTPMPLTPKTQGECRDPSKIIYSGAGNPQNSAPEVFDKFTCDNWTETTGQGRDEIISLQSRLQASEKECERLRGDSTIHWRQIDLARIKELEGILGAALEAMKIWIEGGASRYPYDVMAQLEGTAVERHELK